MLVVAVGAAHAPSIKDGAHDVVATRTGSVSEIRAAIEGAPLHHEVALVAPPLLARETREMVGLVAELTSRSVVHWQARTNLLSLYVALRTLPDLPRDPALALAALEAQVAASWALTWFPRVAGLHFPTPSLGQHMRSWLPGSGFVARFDDEPITVHAADQPLTDLEMELTPGTRAVRYGPVPLDVVGSFAAKTGHRVETVYVVDADLELGHHSWYGISRVAELAAVPPRPGEPGAIPPPPAFGTCTSCGWQSAGPNCPFCRVRVQADPVIARGDRS